MFKLFGKKFKVQNTRRFKRIRSAYLVKYEVNGKEGGGRITNAQDISAGGLRFWADDQVPESSLLNISIFIPPLERFVHATARILRIRRVKGALVYMVAVSFLDLKQEDREAINRFAETLSRDKEARFLIDHADIVIRRQ